MLTLLLRLPLSLSLGNCCSCDCCCCCCCCCGCMCVLCCFALLCVLWRLVCLLYCISFAFSSIVTMVRFALRSADVFGEVCCQAMMFRVVFCFCCVFCRVGFPILDLWVVTCSALFGIAACHECGCSRFTLFLCAAQLRHPQGIGIGNTPIFIMIVPKQNKKSNTYQTHKITAVSYIVNGSEFNPIKQIGRN